MEDNGSVFLLNDQSAAGMKSAMQAVASIIEKSPTSIPNIPLPSYVTPATLHTPQVSTNSPQMAPTAAATPFGINDILIRTASADITAGNFHGNGTTGDFGFIQTPNSGSNFKGRRAAAVAARLAAILFNHQNWFL